VSAPPHPHDSPSPAPRTLRAEPPRLHHHAAPDRPRGSHHPIAAPSPPSPAIAVSHRDPRMQTSVPTIHPAVNDGGVPLIACIAEGLAAVSVPSEPAARTSLSERRYELLLSTAQYNAWLVHWPVGSGLQPHDHAGSAGAFSVVCGVLEEDNAVNGGAAPRRVESGTTVWFTADHVHALANRGLIGATAVHVYAPPWAPQGIDEVLWVSEPSVRFLLDDPLMSPTGADNRSAGDLGLPARDRRRGARR
jgi:Cysteine dioxygenase type I